MVTFRVFGPFLFSLGRRYDKADSLFASMSSHIRDKSTRKEAVWRQQTLLAAFTSSGAKQRINTAAGTVVDEIVAEIKHFADPKEEEGIRIAVRRIVKLAAETWRFARLEREMIAATMPAVHDDKHAFAGPEYWPPYKADDTPITSLAGTAIVDEPPKLLLRLFPVIHREPKHENFRISDDEQPDEGCIYHHGLALYDDAKPVENRREELKAAGLPPITNPSPTAADFPPPIIPPPRNPPPPTPDVGAESPIKSLPPASPPVSPIALSEHPIRSIAQSVQSHALPPPSEKTERTPSERAPSEKAPSVKSSHHSRPPSMKSSATPPPPNASSDLSQRSQALSNKSGRSSKAQYSRPPPGPVDYSTPLDAPPTASSANIPTDSVRSSPKSSSHPSSETPSASASDANPPPEPTRTPPPAPDVEEHLTSPVLTEIASALPVPAVPMPADVPPANEALHLSAPTESTIAPSSIPPLRQDRTSETASAAPPLPAPSESAIIPPSLLPLARTYSPNYNPKTNDASPPTPPRSRAPSPLFAAEDEIEALRVHRSRLPSTSSSRRSTPAKASNEELRKGDRPETTRRTSGYSLGSSKPSLDASIKSEKTDRTERSTSSRYTCESRSAAIKALYPNSPLAGVPPPPSTPVRRTSLRREGRRLSGTPTMGTWDTTTGMGATEMESGMANADPSTSHP